MSETPTPIRRPFQFSLRTLLVLVTLCAIPCSWVAWEREWARKRREAIVAIRKLGGEVLSDYLFADTTHTVFLNNTQATDADLEQLEGLTNLKCLQLDGTQITDAGLKHLGGLKQLYWLHLSKTNITDAGLERLRGLNELRWLFLDGTQVTDDGVKTLQQALPNCHIFRYLPLKCPSARRSAG